ncbi:MAG TPA: A24 family peptidase [Acetobacteraceae bacterium]|nr:A24 family peptidase [Acetobacteraceae bacterium]
MGLALTIAQAAGIALLLYAAWRDIAARIIPDEISIAIAAIGLAVRLSEGWMAALASVGVAVLVFIVLLLLAMRGALGGGDVKLAAALAVGFSPAATWDFIFVSVLFGGLLGVIYLAARRRDAGARRTSPAGPGQPLLRRVAAAEAWRLRRGGPLPYAIAIAIGGCLTLLTTGGA